MPQDKKNRGKKKILIGVVISDKMDKTITVKVERLIKHKLYGKTVRSHSKFKAHDPENKAKVNDKVKIVQTRPLSKDKRWRLIQVIK
jgi:small subunit ribosomal protein S17